MYPQVPGAYAFEPSPLVLGFPQADHRLRLRAGAVRTREFVGSIAKHGQAASPLRGEMGWTACNVVTLERVTFGDIVARL
jgi:hypothetical protein